MNDPISFAAAQQVATTTNLIKQLTAAEAELVGQGSAAGIEIAIRNILMPKNAKSSKAMMLHGADYHPVLVVRHYSSGKYMPATPDGVKQIQSAIELGWTRISCKIFERD